MNLQHDTLRLAEQLIARRSVTPVDAGCQQLIGERLAACGFALHWLVSGPDDFKVINLWAIRCGSTGDEAKLLVLAGHTDVVPTGPLERWTSDPFVPSHRDGLLFGRGAADMKSSLAAMVVAVEHFVADQPQHAGSIAFLLTSDEEGPARDGTVRVVDWLREQGTRLDYCIVGEPTSVTAVGDMVKHGRRGSLSGRLTVHGLQGHVAYPHLADNPIHRLAAPLAELAAMRWDEGNEHFPPTSFQVSNVHAGTGVGNVIPGEAVIDFNLRYGTASTPEQLEARVQEVLDRHGLKHTLAWALGAMPFLTAPGTLTDAMRASIRAVTGREAVLSTTGGTSDGRFIAQICPQLVELGPVNASIHKIDEHVTVAELGPLAQIYRGVLERLIA